LKIIEKDIDVLSKTNAALKLLNRINNKLISERAISEADTLLSTAELKKYHLETIISKSDKNIPPVSPLYSPGSPKTTILQSPKTTLLQNQGSPKTDPGSPGSRTSSLIYSTGSPLSPTALYPSPSPIFKTPQDGLSDNFSGNHSNKLSITTEIHKLEDELDSSFEALIYDYSPERVKSWDSLPEDEGVNTWDSLILTNDRDSYAPRKGARSRDSLIPTNDRDSYAYSPEQSHDLKKGSRDLQGDLKPKKKYESLCVAKVRYSYEAARDSQELSVKVGDRIEVMEKSVDG
jgi:hypothetical protein